MTALVLSLLVSALTDIAVVSPMPTAEVATAANCRDALGLLRGHGVLAPNRIRDIDSLFQQSQFPQVFDRFHNLSILEKIHFMRDIALLGIFRSALAEEDVPPPLARQLASEGQLFLATEHLLNNFSDAIHPQLSTPELRELFREAAWKNFWREVDGDSDEAALRRFYVFVMDKIFDRTIGLNSRDSDEISSFRAPSELGPALWSERHEDGYASSYLDLITLFDELRLSPDDIFEDFGSGAGRACLIGGIIAPGVNFRGYEIISSRLKEAIRVQKNLKLMRVEFEQVDLASEDFIPPKANVYFMYDAVNPRTFHKLIDQIFDSGPMHGARLVLVEGQGHGFAAAKMDGRLMLNREFHLPSGERVRVYHFRSN